MTNSILNIVLCPGCGKRLPIRNGGSCACGWENPDGHIGRVRDYLSKDCRLNDVCSLFLNRLRDGDIPSMGK